MAFRRRGGADGEDRRLLRLSNAGAVIFGAFVVAAVGLALSRAAEPGGSPLGPGVVILAAAAVLACVDRRWARVAAVAVLAVVLVNRLGDGLYAGLIGERGGGAAVGSWGLVAACLVVLVVSAPSVASAVRRRRASRPPASGSTSGGGRGRVGPGHPGLALALMLLSAICAEQLAAYDDTTGRPVELVAGAVVFGCLYGGPALLIREFVRRTGRGWAAILLLATAAGLVQAGLVDQSMFNDSYREIESWDELWGRTAAGPLGLSVYATQAFIVGHVVYSYSAPIALMEAIRPKTGERPWVGWKTLSVVAVLYLAVAGLVLGDTLVHEPTHPSFPQVVGTLAVVALLVLAAVRTPRAPTSTRTDQRAPRPLLVFVAAFAAATLLAIAPSTWAGVAISGAVLALGGALLVRASRRAGWGLRHVVAVAAGAVLSRAFLAFTYYPVIGDVSPARKYAHNTAMLLLVAAVIAFAVMRSRRQGALAEPSIAAATPGPT